MNTQQETSASHRLAHMPVAFFSTVMGLAGLTIAAQKAESVLGYTTGVPLVLALLAAGVFAVLAVLFGLKILRHRAAVLEEINHPIKLHFLPAISIGLILLSIVAGHYSIELSHFLFLIGVPLHLFLTLFVLHYWFNREHFQLMHLNPAWFIPIVGNVLVPVPGVALGYVEISWFFFSIGMIFWVTLFAILMNRVLFHHPLPERLAPTLFILIAPPAVGFLAYMRLNNGQIDGLARVLYYFALFMTLFLTTQVPRLLRMKFFLSWWAYSFPLAAITIASWVMAEKLAYAPLFYIAGVLTLLVFAAVIFLVGRTVLAIMRHEICVPE